MQNFNIGFAKMRLQHGFGGPFEGIPPYTAAWIQLNDFNFQFHGNNYKSDGALYLTAIIAMEKFDQVWVEFDKDDQSFLQPSQVISSSQKKPCTHMTVIKLG